MNSNKKGFTLIEMIFTTFRVMTISKPYIYQWFPVFHFFVFQNCANFSKIFLEYFVPILSYLIEILNGFTVKRICLCICFHCQLNIIMT